jgi:putative membrane protein
MHGDRGIAKGVLAGLLGGLAGAWAMNEFQAVSQGVNKAWKRSAHQPEKPQSQGESQEDDATMKTADSLSMLFTHRHLSKDQKKKAGPIVHYAYGALMGAVYGAIAEMAPAATKGVGTAYATAVWLGGDEIGVPALGLSKAPTAYPASVHINGLATHLVYGASLDLVRRGVRALI